MNAKEETEPEVPRVGNSLIETADDVILISDDDDDVENESVIIISSDSDDCAEDIEFVKVIEQNQRGVPAVKVEKSFSPDLYSVKSHVNLELSSPSTEKGFFILSTDDLPDIPILNSQPISPEAISKCADSDEDVLINYFNENLPFQDKNRKRSFESDQPISPEAISKCADSDKDVLINYFNENLPFQDKNRTSSSESDDWRVRSPIRPLLKKQKLEYKDLPSKILHGDNKKKIAQNLLLGQLNRNLRNSCTKDIDCCYFTHRQEGTASPTGAQLKCLLETMLTDDSLQYFALRTMCKAVNRKQYLSKKVCNMLLEHIYGCEEKMEAPVLQHLYLGISILNKQLFLHPTCRDNMRKYYLEICETWWPVLMRSASALITDDISPHPLPVTSIEPEVSSDESFQPVKVLNDFSDISSKKEAMKHKFFQNLTRAEKIHRITIILNYFTSVMQSNVMVWLIKYRYHKKTAAFRKDVSPIIAEITWKNDVLNFGSVNFYLKQLFQLFARTSKEQSLHRVFSVMIHIHAVVLHRKEKSSFPEMGSLIQGFAHQLFLEIKATPNVEENVNSIHPHWLRFLIGSYLLGVEEPANFFKAKERIHQLLKTKDKGQYLLCPFDVEKLCLYVLESMCNMMGFQSETDYLPSIEKIVEDESVWFFEMLTDDFFRKNVGEIRSTLSLPTIKNRRGYYFDYVEK